MYCGLQDRGFKTLFLSQTSPYRVMDVTCVRRDYVADESLRRTSRENRSCSL
jgi:hypothetical protein